MIRQGGRIPFLRPVWPLAAVLFLTAAPLTESLRAEPGAEAMYTAALADERGLRRPGIHPSLNDLRAAISRYEAIVRRFP